MKKIGCILALFCLIVGAMQAQGYKTVKINLSNGLQVKGRDAQIDGEKLTLTTRGVMQEYNMGFVTTIQAKEGKAEAWALGCGLGCMGTSALLFIIQGDQALEERGTSISQYMASAVLWSGISAGLGYFIGSFLDPYEVVYVKQSSLLRRIHLDVTTQPLAIQPLSGKGSSRFQIAEPMLSLTCRF